MSFREFLRGLDFDQETIDTVMAEYGKNMTALKEKNEEMKDELKSLKEQAEKIDIEAIKKEEYQKGIQEGNKEFETFKKSIALEKALANSKAKDVKLLEKLLDNGKINYEEKDGNFTVKGLDDQLKSIKESHSYLFEEENNGKQPSIDLGGVHETTPQTNNAGTLLSALHEKYDK